MERHPRVLMQKALAAQQLATYAFVAAVSALNGHSIGVAHVANVLLRVFSKSVAPQELVEIETPRG